MKPWLICYPKRDRIRQRWLLQPIRYRDRARQWLAFPDQVRYPYGAETLEKSHETPYGTRPKLEITQPEGKGFYSFESTHPTEYSELEYGIPSHAIPPRSDYSSVWPVSV